MAILLILSPPSNLIHGREVMLVMFTGLSSFGRGPLSPILLDAINVHVMEKIQMKLLANISLVSGHC